MAPLEIERPDCSVVTVEEGQVDFNPTKGGEGATFFKGEKEGGRFATGLRANMVGYFSPLLDCFATKVKPNQQVTLKDGTVVEGI